MLSGTQPFFFLMNTKYYIANCYWIGVTIAQSVGTSLLIVDFCKCVCFLSFYQRVIVCVTEAHSRCQTWRWTSAITLRLHTFDRLVFECYYFFHIGSLSSVNNFFLEGYLTNVIHYSDLLPVIKCNLTITKLHNVTWLLSITFGRHQYPMQCKLNTYQ